MILLVAATSAELCGHPGLACGVGPVDAAAATARALARELPDGVLHFGLAGALGLDPGALVVGTEAVYSDLAAGIPVVSRVEPDAWLLALAHEALPEAVSVPIVTSASVGRAGSDPAQSDPGGHVAVEAMEGFAVLRACALAGVPAVEVRAVSNAIGEEDRSRWEIGRGLETLGGALPRLLAALGDGVTRP